MSKNIEDIIVPEKKRSIRNIPIPEGRRKENKFNTLSTPSSTPSQPQSSTPVIPLDNFDLPRKEQKIPSISRRRIWLVAGGTVVALALVFLSIFNGATLAYIPKSVAVSFNKDVYTAEKVGEGKLLYSIIKFSKDKGIEALATGEANVSRKANGTIIVYNDASTESQRLITNTRFETPNGLIYRTPSSIVIPGKKNVAGISQPGSIEVVVYADEAGEKYNINLSDFTLPGLKGGARFTTIYARSKTKMSGGFVGQEKVLSTQDQARVNKELEQGLREELVVEVKAQVPEDLILFPALSSVTFEDLPQTVATSKNGVKINKRGNFFGVMFKKSDLVNHLVAKKTTLDDNESVEIDTLDSLNLAFASSSPTDLATLNEIKFSVTGLAKAIWHTDEVALKADLAGKNKKDIPLILKNYPTITSATATIRPFWKSSFPANGSKITVKKLSPQ